MHRWLAATVAGVIAASSAHAGSMDCPAMRARAHSHCCCSPGPTGAPRLTCCAVDDEAGAAGSPARELHESTPLAPIVAVVTLSHPGALRAPPLPHAPALAARAASPPPIPLRV